MTWPTTKASNQHTDNATDSIANARVDINQNITNVNLIIDHLDISTPNDGDVIQYNATSGVWESVDVENISSTKIALYNLNGGMAGATFTDYFPLTLRTNLELTSDVYDFTTPTQIPTQSETYPFVDGFTLSAGSYLFEMDDRTSYSSPIDLGFFENNIIIEDLPDPVFTIIRTITEDTHYHFRASNNVSMNVVMKITKL